MESEVGGELKSRIGKCGGHMVSKNFNYAREGAERCERQTAGGLTGKFSFGGASKTRK